MDPIHNSSSRPFSINTRNSDAEHTAIAIASPNSPQTPNTELRRRTTLERKHSKSRRAKTVVLDPYYPDRESVWSASKVQQQRHSKHKSHHASSASTLTAGSAESVSSSSSKSSKNGSKDVKLGCWGKSARCITCLIPSAILQCCGMKSKIVRQAFREKLTILLIVLLISLIVAFILFAMTDLVCKQPVPITERDIQSKFSDVNSNRQYVMVRGRIYNMGWYRQEGLHGPFGSGNQESDATRNAVDSWIGKDISYFFPPLKQGSSCTRWPSESNTGIYCNPAASSLSDTNNYCHVSGKAWKDLAATRTNEWVGYTWEDINRKNAEGRHYFVYSGMVYDLKRYFDQPERYLGEEYTDRLLALKGEQTRYFSRDPEFRKNLVPCFNEQFIVGQLDGTTTGCAVAVTIQIVPLIVLFGIAIMKVLSAILFDWFMSRKLGKMASQHPKSNVILLVTAYSEDEKALRSTLDSLAATDYRDDQKLLVVVADGNVTGSGNKESTPEMLKRIINIAPWSDEEPKAYVSLGEDEDKLINMAQVFAGTYEYEPSDKTLAKSESDSECKKHSVPVILIVKVGNESETGKQKAGNRGKRDSHLVIMDFLSRVAFNERLTPLQHEIFRKIKRLTKNWPDTYELMLTVDADTYVRTDALRRMVHCMESDPLIVGLCGETRVANKFGSFATMIQVFEYHIGHVLGKAFESVFGGVTCLPGCFAMYRIKVRKTNGYFIPLLANPDIVLEYASDETETLHRKNLLLLGEDRYLTTLMLKTFPKRKMVYVPKAICHTQVPESFRVLFSQRRRWINSTIHNLLELIMVRELCGIFCCSMQFVIFLELLGTAVLPASFLLLIYLAVTSILNQSIALPLVLFLIGFFLQAILVTLTSFRIEQFFWLIMYVLGLPVWYFFMPLYSFWHMDDFSWGHTRQVKKDGQIQQSFKEDYFIHKPGGQRSSSSANGINPRSRIPQKRWTEWEMMHREKDREMMMKDIQERKLGPAAAANTGNNGKTKVTEMEGIEVNSRASARFMGSMLVAPPPRRHSLLR